MREIGRVRGPAGWQAGLAIDPDGGRPGHLADQRLDDAVLGRRRQHAAEPGVAEVGVDQQRLGAVGGEQAGEVGGDRRFALIGQHRDDADDLAGQRLQHDIAGDAWRCAASRQNASRAHRSPRA